jgi:NAD(P)-dependent dehydrogenase (short-subunit alcohol dehydrogenase family)
MNFSLEDRAALITGANQGLGLAIAKAYVVAGAHVFLCARNKDLLDAACTEVKSHGRSDQKIFASVCDVTKPGQVESVVENARSKLGSIDILVNNAGIYGPKGILEENDWSEWRDVFSVNLYGSVLMCRALLPHFRARGYGKIIQISGGGATNPLPRLSAYAASKAAVVRFAETIAEETRGTGIDVNSVAPGALCTRMLDEVLEAGPERVGLAFYERMKNLKAQGGTPLEVGAGLAVFLGSSASDGISGKLLSAPWDPWESLADRREELKGDIYTLRRVIPRDRGQNWGDRP